MQIGLLGNETDSPLICAVYPTRTRMGSLRIAYNLRRSRSERSRHFHTPTLDGIFSVARTTEVRGREVATDLVLKECLILQCLPRLLESLGEASREVGWNVWTNLLSVRTVSAAAAAGIFPGLRSTKVYQSAYVSYISSYIMHHANPFIASGTRLRNMSVRCSSSHRPQTDSIKR